MRILVIGGTRFMGRALVKRLAAGGHTVTCLTRSGAGSEGPVEGVHYLTGDRRQPGVVDGAVRHARPEAVVDMMAMTEADAEALVGCVDCPLVVASSCDVYRNYGGLLGLESGAPDPVPLTEESPVRTSRYPYRGGARAAEIPWLDDYDKILVEERVLAKGGSIVRLPMVFGHNDYQHRLYEYARRMEDGRPAILLSDRSAHWKGCRGFVDDMAVALERAILSPQAREVFNVAYDPCLTELEWLGTVGEAVGWKGASAVLPDGDLPQGLRTDSNTDFDLCVSSEKIRARLGYAETVPLLEALRRTVEWELSHPPDGFVAPDYAAEDEALARASRAQ